MHNRSHSLEISIKLHKDLEYNYNKSKIKTLNNEIDELKFQKKFYVQRDNDILKDIQNYNLKSVELSSRTNKSLENLNETEKSTRSI